MYVRIYQFRESVILFYKSPAPVQAPSPLDISDKIVINKENYVAIFCNYRVLIIPLYILKEKRRHCGAGQNFMADTANLNLRHEARTLGIPLRQIQTVAELLDEGNTIPFIARYRKDQTGGLDEVQLRKIQARLEKIAQLNERKQAILRSIESQGLLTDELREKIESASTSKRLEDIYLPYKPKKQTLAASARERGLEPLADAILAAAEAGNLEEIAAPFVSTEKGVNSVQDALAGAGHIIAERFSENIELRQALREILQRSGKIVCSQMENVSSEAVEQFIKAESTPAQAAEEPAAEEAVAEESVAEESVAEEAVAEEPAAEEPATEEAVVEEPAAEEPVAEEPVAEEPATEEPVADSVEADAAEIDVAFALAQNALADKDQVVVSKNALKRQHKAELHAREVAAAGDLAAIPTPQKTAQKKKKSDKKAELEQKLHKAFMDYFNFQEDIRKIPPHRILALNRGERAKVLRVKLEYDSPSMKSRVNELSIPANHPYADFLSNCAEDALVRLTMPSLEREARRELTERAETHAVDVFAKNLSNLLLQPPVRNLRVLAADPGYKSGCKLVALDQFGNFLDRNVAYIAGKKSKNDENKQIVLDMVTKNGINVVAIGNGTACRETEEFFANLIATTEEMKNVSYVIVNEAGASVYSASPLAREEFPEFDATVRGSISIGRRLLDPLSELVKIDPANIGVGLYQHDIKTKNLKDSLAGVVESCVNFVGVDVNLASPSLLRFVSGLNQLTAKRIYEYRCQNGPFKNRQQLLSVSGLGEQTFIQAAGFLKIPHGDEPLDTTWIHPESYEATKKVLAKLNFSEADLIDKSKTAELEAAVAGVNVPELAKELEIGELTLKDILAQLVRPGRDPRETLPPPVFKQGVLKLEDLEPGMNLKGTVLNVVDFGAFIDIGMYDSGLVHVSELADKYVRDPHEVVSVGDIVDTWVVSVDKDRRRVSLTLIDPSKPRTQTAPHGRRNEENGEGKENSRPRRPARKPRSDRPRQEGESQDRPQGEGKEGAQGERREFSRRPRRESSDQNNRREGAGRQEGGERRPRRDGDRNERGSRKEWASKPREFVSKAPANSKPSLTDKQKSGKEPMRSFGDLAELFKIKKDPETGESQE